MRLLIPLVRALFRLLYRVEVKGEFRSGERTLIVANHQSFLDPFLFGCFLPVWPAYLVNTTIAAKWYSRIGLRFMPHAIADTTKPMAMKTLLALVESGQPVVIFPEGRITVTGSLMKIYDGPAFVAAKTGCTVVPVRIDGAMYTPFSRLGANGPRKLFPRMRLTIGTATTIPMPEAPRARDRRRLASESMRRLLQRTEYEARQSSTLFESMLDAADLHGWKRPVLQDINTNFQPQTYKLIVRGALALGRLVSRFTEDGDTVGVLMPNANATVSLLLGVTSVRRVPAMLNYTSGAAGMENACRTAQARVVLTSHAFIEKAGLGDVVAAMRGVEIVYLEDLRAQFGLLDKLWVLRAVRNPRKFVPKVDSQAPAVVMFTSGSEGTPKGVVLSHDSILANVAQINAAYAFSSADRFLSALPLFHAFGLTAGVLLPLLKGCSTILYPSPAALPHCARVHVRPRLHRPIHHEHVPAEVCPGGTPVRFLQRAAPGGRGRKADR